MYAGQLVFSQLIDHLPWQTFRRIVERYRGDRRIRNFSCANQFRCMAFAQLTHRESLRDIVTCLRGQSSKLYHLGIRGRVARSTPADANEARDWRIYAEFAQHLIRIARRLYVDEPFGELIAWATVPGAIVRHAGFVRFQSEEGDTRVQVQMSYNPLGSVVGHEVASLFGTDPQTEMNEDLARLKMYFECGKRARDAAQP